MYKEVQNSCLISIVIPAYNREDIIGDTLESVLSQTYENWELIIVDDNSSDNTVSVVQSYVEKDQRIRLLYRPETKIKGANSCRNYGFELSKGEFIKWLDSDDILKNNALEDQLATIKEQPNLKVCFSHGRFFNNDTLELEERWSRKAFSDDLFWDHIRNEIMWPIGGPLWKKAFFESAPFDEDLKNSQEWLMHGIQLLRLASNEYSILDEDLYFIRRGNIRMSSNKSSNYYYNQAKARKKLLHVLKKKYNNVRYIRELIKQYLIYSFHSIRVKIH